METNICPYCAHEDGELAKIDVIENGMLQCSCCRVILSEAQYRRACEAYADDINALLPAPLED